MPKEEISASDLTRRWGPNLNRVISGEHLYVTRYGSRVAALIPARDVPEDLQGEAMSSTAFVNNWTATLNKLEAGAALKILRHGRPVAWCLPPEFAEGLV
jgi:antitoxin (DNA-binding transcriptional repressor) of toxin-antitoxin stability system